VLFKSNKKVGCGGCAQNILVYNGHIKDIAYLFGGIKRHDK